MHGDPVSRFLRSSDRTTVPPSPTRPAEEPIELCGPVPGALRFTPEDLAAVWPLLMLGRGFEPPPPKPARILRLNRAKFPKISSRRAHSHNHLRQRAPRVRAPTPRTALEELAQCAAEQQSVEPAIGAADDDEEASCYGTDATHYSNLLSSPPAETTDSPFEGKAVALAERPDSSSSLPSPPLSPQAGNRARLCPLVHEHRSTKKHSRACIACGSRQTPCWRPSWDPVQGKLCNSCGLRFRKSRARCVTSGCARIPARSELAEARMHAAGRPVRCKNCGGRLLFYSTTTTK